MLLARDTPAGAPAVKELGLDLALWQPLIVDRQFVDWLVKHPSDQVGAGRCMTGSLEGLMTRVKLVS